MKFEEYTDTSDSTAEDEKAILIASLKETQPEVVVEVGTHGGLTALYLADALMESGKWGAQVHTYDPFDKFGARAAFDKFPLLPIQFHVQKGSECDLERIDWLFIDGYHEKDAVLEEIDALFPKLSDGAVVFFHDTNGSNPFCDVPGAIDERKLNVEYMKTTNGLAKYIHNK